MGWVPHDGDTCEWDETERGWMSALQIYENSRKCPVCGMDTDFCHDEEKVRALFAGGQVETCFVGQMREQAMQEFAKSGTVLAPNSQTTSLVPKPLKTTE
jgi:hypothetical protein